LPYYDLLEELFSGVGTSGKFARTGAIESEAERDEAALRAGLEAGETAELEQAGENFGVQSEQDLAVIGSAMPNNSTLTDVDILNHGMIAGSSSPGSNSLVRSRSGLSDEGGGDSGEMSDGGHRNKRIRTNKNSKVRLPMLCLLSVMRLSNRDSRVRQGRRKRQSTSFLSFMLTLMSIPRLRLQSSCLLFRREKMQLGFWQLLNLLVLEPIGLLHNLYLNVCNR